MNAVAEGHGPVRLGQPASADRYPQRNANQVRILEFDACASLAVIVIDVKAGRL